MILTVVSLLIGVAGVIATVLFARKAENASRERRRLEWSDLQAAANDLGKKIRRDCSPIAIVTPGLTGATFANLLADEFPNQPPVFVGVRVWKEDTHGSVTFADTFKIETSKWLIFVPRLAADYTDGEILILDDFVMSGDFLEKLRSSLVEAGVKSTKIRSAAIVATKVAINSHKAPDYYWWTAEDDNFYFPWGKAR
jgi:hypoxanthine phosphoribosyltransferase